MIKDTASILGTCSVPGSVIQHMLYPVFLKIKNSGVSCKTKTEEKTGEEIGNEDELDQAENKKKKYFSRKCMWMCRFVK